MFPSSLDVAIKILDPRLKTWYKEHGGVPGRATSGSAGYDVVACCDEPVALFAGGEAHVFGTGFAMHIGDPRVGAFAIPRSGLGIKSGVILANGTGLIDSDYQGEMKVGLYNRRPAGAQDVIINPGDRICQIVFLPIIAANFLEVEKFDNETARGEGGFGSTGVAHAG